MLTLIPFHKGDAAMASRMLNLSAKLGFITQHQCVCMYPNDTPQSLIAEVEKAARSAFKDVEMFQIPHEIPENWPAGPNKMFATGCTIMFRKWGFEAEYLGKYQAQNGMFLWMEPDMVPLQPGYLDRLQQEYLMGGKPCLGVIVPTIKQKVIRREEAVQRDVITNTVPLGEPTELGEKYIDGEHMVGAGIYDRGLSALITWINEAAGLADPFDVTLQHEICQKEGGSYTRITPSQLIVHNWNSSNYRITRPGDISEIECDAHEDNPGQKKFILSKYATVGPCLAHGCKDDSLHKIVEQIHGLTVKNVIESAMSEEGVSAFTPTPYYRSSVNENPQGMQISNGPNPFKVTTAEVREETQVIVGGKPYMVPTSQFNSKTYAMMEELDRSGANPMEAFYKPPTDPVAQSANLMQAMGVLPSVNVTHSIVQSSPMADPEHESDDLSPEEMRIYAKLQANLDRRQNHKKNAKKAKSVSKKAAVAKLPVRKTIDETEVWNFYSSQPESVSWKETLRRFRLSPRQLKEIREKNQAVA